MKIINACADIDSFFPDGKFTLATWRTYADSFSAELASKCIDDIADYDFEQDVLPVVQTALDNREKRRAVSHTFAAVTRKLSDRIRLLYDSEPELDIVLYLGLCNAAGWATTLDGNRAVLLGFEKLIELNWCDENALIGLLYHEIGHIWHADMGGKCPEMPKQSHAALWQLYSEGVAMLCEQLLCGEENYFHQDKDGWLAWCQENEGSIKREYLRRMEQGESVQDFFGDWARYEGHPDVGYYLGVRFVRGLYEKYGLKQTAVLPFAQLEQEFLQYANA